MKRSMYLVVWLAALSTTGCATHSIQQGKDLSTSGIAYADAVNKMLDVAVDRVIDFDTQELRKTRRGTDLEKMILEKNAAVARLIMQIEEFRARTKVLKAYFLNLQALADSPVKNDVGGAVQSLSDSVSKFNQVLAGKDGKEKLTAEQKREIGALGGLTANSIHAYKVKQALTRDAEIIGAYLCYQENQLQNIAKILQDRFEAENELFVTEKVVAPYADRNQALGSDWAGNRKQWIKTYFVCQQLDTAQQAARLLRGVWTDLLQGKTDLNSLSVLISDVNEFVTTVQALETAGKTE